MQRILLLLAFATVATFLRIPPSAGQGVWKLHEPNITWDEWNNTFTFYYSVHPSLNETENLRVDILYPDCEPDEKLGVGEGIIQDYINGSGYHVFEVDPWNISHNPRLFNYSGIPEERIAIIDICLNAMLWTGPDTDPTARQVTSFETLVTIYIDLTKEFEVSFNSMLLGPGLGYYFAENQFEVFAYLCDPITQIEIEDALVNQGDLVTVCVEVTQPAIDEGVYIDRITEFEWFRDFDGAFNVTQVVIDNSSLVQPEISSYECVPPLIVCDFSSMLWADFFISAGEMIGVGEARLAFAPLNATINRQLIVEYPRRKNKNKYQPQQVQQQRNRHQSTQVLQAIQRQQERRRWLEEEEPTATPNVSSTSRSGTSRSGFGFEMDLQPLWEGLRPAVRTAGATSSWTILPAVATSLFCILMGMTWIVLD